MKKRLAARSKRSGDAGKAMADAQGTTTAHAEHAPPRNGVHEAGGSLGLPDDPEGDVNEAIEEMRQEVRLRRERGQSIGQGLQEALRAKIGEVGGAR